MKRVIALLAVIALFVGGFAVGVNAESRRGRRPTSSGLEDRFTPLSPQAATARQTWLSGRRS
jgi:hypothetical protein